MEGRLRLTVVTPEESLLERLECDEVTLPAEEGALGVLPGHTPLITLLKIGEVMWRDGHLYHALAVKWGFAEISGDSVRVLADVAEAKESVDIEAARREKAEGERLLLSAAGEHDLDVATAKIEYATARLRIAGGM